MATATDYPEIFSTIRKGMLANKGAKTCEVSKTDQQVLEVFKEGLRPSGRPLPPRPEGAILNVDGIWLIPDSQGTLAPGELRFMGG